MVAFYRLDTLGSARSLLCAVSLRKKQHSIVFYLLHFTFLISHFSFSISQSFGVVIFKNASRCLASSERRTHIGYGTPAAKLG